MKVQRLGSVTGRRQFSPSEKLRADGFVLGQVLLAAAARGTESFAARVLDAVLFWCPLQVMPCRCRPCSSMLQKQSAREMIALPFPNFWKQGSTEAVRHFTVLPKMVMWRPKGTVEFLGMM